MLKVSQTIELIEKNLAVSSSGILQSLDYAYNPQGWLTSINQATLGGTNVALTACEAIPNPGAAGGATFIPDPNDLFYLELKYDGQFTGMTGDTLQKNGNINQMMWRTRGRERQAYNFNYDYLDRLLAARYYDVNDAGTVTASSRYNESLAYADARGNISALKRQGGDAGTGCWIYNQIDNLSYNYTSGTNKISSIADSAPATWKNRGFKPGSGSYAYDTNGNLNSDPYKSMTVQYNHLNLPKLFTFGSNSVEILYDAAGTKLKKTVKTGATTNYTQYYIDGIEYRNGAREAIYTAEGRVFYTGPATTRYEYSIKDHLGNARLSFTDKNGNGVVDETNNPTTNEVLQENNYYPFGLNTEGPWMNDAALDNKYQYNGKELNDDFGLNLNDFGARFYDPSIGRFVGVDPIASNYAFVTTYNYAENEPVANIDLWGFQKLRVGDYTMAFILGATDAAVSNVTGKEKMSEETLIGPLQGAMQAGETFGDMASILAGGIGTTLGIEATVGGTLALPESGGLSSVVVVGGVVLIDLGANTSANGLKNFGGDVAKMVDSDGKKFGGKSDSNSKTSNEALRNAKDQNGIPRSQQPDKTIKPNTPEGNKAGLDSRNSKQYEYTNSKGEKVSIRQDKPATYNDGGKGNQGKHYNAGSSYKKLKQHHYYEK